MNPRVRKFLDILYYIIMLGVIVLSMYMCSKYDKTKDPASDYFNGY
jgi:hypothetical protein